MTIDWRSGFDEDVLRSSDVRAAARDRAERIAAEATRLGRWEASTYKATVVEEEGAVRVGGHTRARQTTMNLGKAIEHGNWRFPAVAPLRRGADAAGLRTGGGR